MMHKCWKLRKEKAGPQLTIYFWPGKIQFGFWFYWPFHLSVNL